MGEFQCVKFGSYLWSNPLNSDDAFSAYPVSNLDKIQFWILAIRLLNWFSFRTEVGCCRDGSLCRSLDNLKYIQVSIPRKC